MIIRAPDIFCPASGWALWLESGTVVIMAALSCGGGRVPEKREMLRD
jgi:hypothetical protein